MAISSYVECQVTQMSALMTLSVWCRNVCSPSGLMLCMCVCTCAAPPCCGAVNPAAGSFPGCCAPVAPAVGCIPASELHTPSCSAPVWPSAWPGSPGASHSPSACLEELKVVNLVKYVIPGDNGKIFRVL